MIRHNIGYKLMALAVAVVLWSYVNGERNPQTERTFTVPVKVLNVAQGFVAEPEVSEVTIKVNGPKLVIDAVGREDLSAAVDVGTGKEKADGQVVSAKVQPSLDEAEGELSVTVIPKTIRVRLAKLGGQMRPVEVKFPAAPPLGYVYGNPVITPAGVGIIGNDSNVARVRRVVLTIPDSLNGKSVDDRLPVTPVDAKGVPVAGVELDPSKVRLKLELIEAPVTKRVIVSPDVTGVPAVPGKITRIDAEPALATLQGSPEALTGITTIDTDSISIEGLSSTVTREVGLRLPPGVTATGGDKVWVTVKISQPGE